MSADALEELVAGWAARQPDPIAARAFLDWQVCQLAERGAPSQGDTPAEVMIEPAAGRVFLLVDGTAWTVDVEGDGLLCYEARGGRTVMRVVRRGEVVHEVATGPAAPAMN